MIASLDRPAKLSVEGLEVRYPSEAGGLLALAGVDLEVREGEFVSVLGPSGCGKSTLLGTVAGLGEPSQGRICLDGDPDARRLGRIGYMPQRDLLMPWRSVLDNTCLGLEVAGVSRRMARARAREWLTRFGLEGFEEARPAELSAGMRQRAALLRTFLTGRDITVLDEPFGKLDSLTRLHLQQWFRGICESQQKTVLMITHDIEEAIFLSDRIYVLSPRPGEIVHTVAVQLPVPREYRKAVADPVFLSLKQELLAVLHRGEDDR